VVRLFFALIGAAAFEGSILEWATDHRNHHRYTDQEKDPYNIKQGFFHAHIGWLIYLDPKQRDFSNVEDLQKDPIVAFQHRFYVPLALFFCFVVPTLLASLWGDAKMGFLLAGCLRVAFNHHATFCINSVCHLFGSKTYSSQQSARDNLFTALFTYGEGYHNFHHQFPLDYRNGIRFYDYDPSKWLIALLAGCGLASHLKRVNLEKILKYRIRNQENHLIEKWADYSDSILAAIHRHLHKMISHLEDLELNYQKLKQQGVSFAHLKQQKFLLRLKRRELKNYFSVCRRLVNYA
jgi:stearoyl-CoA desaturase (delta-9 desaturase)